MHQGHNQKFISDAGMLTSLPSLTKNALRRVPAANAFLVYLQLRERVWWLHMSSCLC